MKILSTIARKLRYLTLNLESGDKHFEDPLSLRYILQAKIANNLSLAVGTRRYGNIVIYKLTICAASSFFLIIFS